MAQATGRPHEGFRQLSYGSPIQQLPAGPSNAQDQLQNAAQAVEDRISAEGQAAPDLETFLRDAPTSSNYLEPPNPKWDPFVQRRTVNVPNGLLDSYGPDTRPRLGLLPEIGRAWIAVENRLFLWDYSGSSEQGSLLTYDEETERISAVGLVAPKKAVFVDTVQYILVICTAISVRLVGLHAEPTANSGAPRLTMYETDRKVGTDGVAPTAVCGTPEGRIFIACEDGALREVDYRAETSWLPWQFTSLASIVTISAGNQANRGIFGRGQAAAPVQTHLAYDASRRNLYSCTSSVIEVYNVGQGSDRPHRIAQVSNICSAAQAKAPNTPALEAASFGVAAIDVISRDESSNVALVVTTTNCVRLYFSLGYGYGFYAGASSSQLNLLHVRIPPQPAAPQGRPAYYPNGQQQQQQPPQGQTYVLRDLRAALSAQKGLFLAANEERMWFAAPHQPPRQQPQQPNVRPEVAMTIDLPGGTFAISEVPSRAGKREFVALNSSLAVTFTHNRPVDTLANLLEGGDRNELAAFSSDNSADLTCALCLELACGGQVSQEVQNAARRVYHEIGSSRSQGPAYGPDGRPTFSPRHQGFAIYLARQLQLLWRLKVTQPALPPADPTSQDTAVPAATLVSVQTGLNGLRTFAEHESSLFAPLPEQFENRPDTAILKAEQASFVGLRSLLIQATEALSFVLLLIDFRLPEIVSTCSPELKQALANLTYKDLLATHQGRDVVRKLVHVIINHRISQGESVDSVSDLLEQRCGSFCSADDILVYKGSESLRVAHDAPNKAEQQRHLRDSLHLFLKAARHIDPEKLREICGAYVEIGYFAGAVELSLACAKSAPAEEPRNSAYDCVLSTLVSANEALDASVAGSSQRPAEEADALRDAAFKKALGADEEVFLFRLYKWNLDKRLLQQLLEVRSDSLERFLTQPPQTQERYDLLWQYYIRNSEYAKAARVLQNLAQSESFHIDLEKRLEYLSLAAGNARSEFPNPTLRQELGEFLTDIDEKLEVAQVQLEVARSIAQADELQRNIQHEMLTALDSRLYTISELFNDFAQPYDMLEVKLLIFYVSEHHDDALIQEVWTDIFARESTKPAKLAKIRQLGRRFHPSESVFPVDWLISILEEEDMKDKSAAEAVADSIVDAFLDAGVAFEELAQAYIQLFNGRIPPWHTKVASEHLVRVSVGLFERWLKTAQSLSYSSSAEGFPASEILDQVDRLVQATQDRGLRDRLTALQKQLQRSAKQLLKLPEQARAVPRMAFENRWDYSNLTQERETFVTNLECSISGETDYPADKLHGLSRRGRPLLVRYELDKVKKVLTKEELAKRPRDMWRWRELLPIRHAKNIVSLGENETPLIRIPRSGGKNVLVKDEGRLPTGSFKTRGLCMAVAMAQELGVKRIAMPSNGNAAAALAAYASRCGIETIVFVPADTPEINVREIAMQGARVWRVNGLIDDCGAIVGKGAAEGRWFDLSTLKEPYRIEGKKTMGLELACQLDWELPDAIFYPTGGGTGLIGQHKAFNELEELGFIGSKRPRMYAVQAAGCAPIVKAFDDGVEHADRWQNSHTVAAGIRVPRAVGDFLILRAVRDTGGKAVSVTDEELSKAQEECAKLDGLLMCPEGAACLAAYKNALAKGEIKPEESVVLWNCATGLKYPMPEANDTLDKDGPIDFDKL